MYNQVFGASLEKVSEVPAINIEATHALSLSLLAYAGSLFWSLVGGVVYVCLKETQHLAEVAREN